MRWNERTELEIEKTIKKTMKNSNYAAAAVAAVAATPSPSKRKILVLHGDRQTGQLLLGRIASLKRKLQKPITKRRQIEGHPPPPQQLAVHQTHTKKKNKKKEKKEEEEEEFSLENHGIELVAPDGPFVWQQQQQQQVSPQYQQEKHGHDLISDENRINNSSSSSSSISSATVNDNPILENNQQTSSDDLLMRTWWWWRHNEPNNNNNNKGEEKNKHSGEGGEGGVKDPPLYHEGLEQSLEMLLDIWNNKNGGNNNHEFEGILGFSRGARMAHFIACLHELSGGRLFSNLKYVVIVSGYGHVPMPENFPPRQEGGGGGGGKDSNLWCECLDDNKSSSEARTMQDIFPLNIPSLHIMGCKDRLIPLEYSRALLSSYVDPVVYEHEGGHHVPMRAADVRTIVDFIDSVCKKSSMPVTVENMIGNHGHTDGQKEEQSCPVPLDHGRNVSLPDEEHALIQREECESISMIFSNEFQLLSPIIQPDKSLETTSLVDRTNIGDEFGTDTPVMECHYEHPISYSVQLRPPREELEQDIDGAKKLWPVKEIALKVEYTAEYPDALPKFSLVHDMNLLEFKLCQEEACLDAVRKVAEGELGMPCMMSCVYGALEFFERGGLLAALARDDRNGSGQRGNDDEKKEEEEEESIPLKTPILASASKERISICIQEGLEIAYSILGYSECHGKDIGYGFENLCTGGKGGSWKFTIGLVGKPSAGKSTFFNAATAFARQRGGDEVDKDGIAIGGAAMAPHPFTTIDPNVGYCLVPAPPGSCPEDDCEDGAPFVACTHGRDSNGRRLIPVLLKDVAGLVPGAYKGRGRGNKFLDDLTDADVLVHVLDSSATADADGNTITVDADSSDALGSNPMNDLDWVFNELIQWVFMNVQAKWASVVKRGRDKLAGLFSGYKQSQAFVFDVLFAVESYLRKREGRDRALDHLVEWDEGDLYRLVAAFLGARFPVTLALNKNDIPSASKFCKEIIESLPLHGAHHGTPMCAQEVMNFVRRHIYSVLAPGREHKCSRESPPHGVWMCLQSAMSLREPVLVFPVSDLETYEPLSSLTDLAINDPSLPTRGMIACLKAAGGSIPSMWQETTAMYQQNSKGVRHVLRDVLVLKPGSTVEDAFLSLKGTGSLRGEFVRAEAASRIGEKPKPIRKDDRLGKHNRILKIMTTRRREWQKNS